MEVRGIYGKGGWESGRGRDEEKKRISKSKGRKCIVKMGNPTWRSVENERGKQEEVEEEGREDEGLETLIADVWNICVWTVQ